MLPNSMRWLHPLSADPLRELSSDRIATSVLSSLCSIVHACTCELTVVIAVTRCSRNIPRKAGARDAELLFGRLYSLCAAQLTHSCYNAAGSWFAQTFPGSNVSAKCLTRGTGLDGPKVSRSVLNCTVDHQSGISAPAADAPIPPSTKALPGTHTGSWGARS